MYDVFLFQRIANCHRVFRVVGIQTISATRTKISQKNMNTDQTMAKQIK